VPLLPLALLHPSSSSFLYHFLRLPVYAPFVRASVIRGLSPIPFFFFPDTGCSLAYHYHETAKVPILGLHLALLRDLSCQWKTRNNFYPFFHPRSRTRHGASSYLPGLQCSVLAHEIGEQEQITFPFSPAASEENAGGRDDDKVEVEGDIVLEVEREEEEEEEEEEINSWSSEEPSSSSGCVSNSLLNLGQPIHPARGGSVSSTARSPPFAFSRATVAPQSKSTSIRELYERHSAHNVETTTTAFSSPSGSSPASSVPSSQTSGCMRHTHASTPSIEDHIILLFQTD
jgi:hypothetical protein